MAFSGTSQNIGFFQKSQNIGFFALFDEDMNRNGIDDQNNDDIINEPKDILKEDVEDDDGHFSCQLW